MSGIGINTEAGAIVLTPDVVTITSYQATAVKAWAEGKASEEQQRSAYAWVCKSLGLAGQHPQGRDTNETQFMLGRHFVGQTLIQVAARMTGEQIDELAMHEAERERTKR